MEAEIAAIANTAASDHQKSGQHVESEERMRVNMLARETRAVEDMNRQRGEMVATNECSCSRVVEVSCVARG